MVTMKAVVLIFLSLAAVVVLTSASQQRIVGGSLTTIGQYPQLAVMLATNDHFWYFHNCGGTILSNVAVLTAAHCHSSVINPVFYRVRVGSSFASSGGVIHAVQQIINHPNYNSNNLNNDISVVRLASAVTFTDLTQPGFIAGTAYIVPDNQPVWAVGWGQTELGISSEQLRHVQTYTINLEICRQRYGLWPITDNMICSGVLDVGGRDACTGDSGGPLLYNNVVVGVASFGYGCGHPHYPGVNARVSQYTAWIINNSG